ncbi:hypothetical protein RRG08_013553 [Elysia crispata]|uniref:Uncharacterized protein n=1 Tax=Elysia crispata TaxID=231223 RepID=A0AAE0Y0Z1_9GAST|nr:hypothetical protein RRG08_013553 [Elysia crispata]
MLAPGVTDENYTQHICYNSRSKSCLLMKFDLASCNIRHSKSASYGQNRTNDKAVTIVLDKKINDGSDEFVRHGAHPLAICRRDRWVSSSLLTVRHGRIVIGWYQVGGLLSLEVLVILRT